MLDREILQVAVIGAGRMGKHHARIYAGHARCKLAAVVDKDIERARAITAEFGGEPLSDISKLDRSVQAATVAVPTVYHADVAIPLMERGVAVLVEKPLANDAATAKRIVDASRKSGLVLQVGHSERYNPVVQAMLRMEVAPRFIEAHRVSPFTFRSADIGVVFDMMIHDIDIVLHLVRDRVVDVQSVGVNVLGPHEDVANARIRFANGTVANLTASRLALKTDRRIRVFCPTAYVTMDYQKKSGLALKLDDNLDLIRMARERNFEDLSQMAGLDFGSMVKIDPLVVADVEPLKAEIETFIESVRTGRCTGVSAEDGLAAVELAEQITTSIREQGWGRSLIPA